MWTGIASWLAFWLLLETVVDTPRGSLVRRILEPI
jgi:hypothetical protein